MPKRIQMHRRPGGWRDEHPDAVIVARPSIFGNPWRPGSPGTFWLPDYPIVNATVVNAVDVETAVTLYRRLLTGGPDPVDNCLPASLSREGLRHTRDALRRHATRIQIKLPGLRGRDLACWCPLDCPCHADILLELANA